MSTTLEKAQQCSMYAERIDNLATGLKSMTSTFPKLWKNAVDYINHEAGPDEFAEITFDLLSDEEMLGAVCEQLEAIVGRLAAAKMRNGFVPKFTAVEVPVEIE